MSLKKIETCTLTIYILYDKDGIISLFLIGLEIIVYIININSLRKIKIIIIYKLLKIIEAYVIYSCFSAGMKTIYWNIMKKKTTKP